MPRVGQMAVNYNVNGHATAVGNIEPSPVYGVRIDGCDSRTADYELFRWRVCFMLISMSAYRRSLRRYARSTGLGHTHSSDVGLVVVSVD